MCAGTRSSLRCRIGRTNRSLPFRRPKAPSGYLTEVAEVREMLDGRYDDIKSGRVKPIDGEAFDIFSAATGLIDSDGQVLIPVSPSTDHPGAETRRLDHSIHDRSKSHVAYVQGDSGLVGDSVFPN